ncbi:guanylate kinase [Amorphus coralli]|uniref:guanylate kinase n=1 Tax=Amorphus coralli TaxID=340680 RepID=UPI00035FBA36|nr:guanylate kinase [Amorphus coralli]
MLVLSSPSGAGKSTISRLVLETDENIGLSISATTRSKRPSEADGVHYHFVSQKRFETMREHDELLEWAEVHGNFYGTPREPVDVALAKGQDILFDIDWQGTLQLYQTCRDDVVSVFILPPSGRELKARLERRAEDDAETIARRLVNAKTELAHWNEYDYVIVNDDLDRALAGVRSILAAERLKRSRAPEMGAFVEGLIADL